MAAYDKGDKVRLTATFTSGGVAADPTDLADDVEVTWRRPSRTNPDTGGGAIGDATPTATKSATGVYYVDINLDEIGTHTVRFKGLEGVVAAEIAEIEVGKSVFDHA